MPNTELAGGYTNAELNGAFGRVKNPDGWKLPVDKVIPAPSGEDWELISFAVMFYTGSLAERVPSADGTQVRVLAAGYYACIGS